MNIKIQLPSDRYLNRPLSDAEESYRQGLSERIRDHIHGQTVQHHVVEYRGPIEPPDVRMMAGYKTTMARISNGESIVDMPNRPSVKELGRLATALDERKEYALSDFLRTEIERIELANDLYNDTQEEKRQAAIIQIRKENRCAILFVVALATIATIVVMLVR